MNIKVFIAIVVALGGGLYLGAKFSHSGEKAGAQAQRQMMMPAVTGIQLKERKVLLEEEYPARVAANRVVEVYPQVGGILLKRLFEEGGNVEKGQPLYQIDSAPFEQVFHKAQADVEKSEAQIKLLEQKVVRYRELVKSNGVSRQELDDVEASLMVAKADKKSAEALLSQANINLGYTKILAPASGRIGKSLVNEGALVSVNQGQALTQITQLNPASVDINQSSADFQRLKDVYAKDKTEVRLLINGSETPYESVGTVQFNEVLVSTGTGSLQIRAAFDNPNLVLLPGMFAKARLKIGEVDGILVPQRATLRNPDGELMVWIINEKNVIVPTVIQSERIVGDQWLVSSGVKAGDRIVYRGFQKARPGSEVQVVIEER